ncbi:MAG: hypothetical protein NVS4B10_10800 [Myxococcales bacterium]
MLIQSLRNLAACASALGVLGFGAWLGGAFAPAAHAARGWGPPAIPVQPAYPGRGGAGGIALGDGLSVGGQPMQLSIFFTPDPPSRVVAWYAEALHKKGLVPVARAEAQVAHVSVFDPEDGLQRSVTALPQPGGETMVLVGVNDPRRPPRLLTGARRAPFPVPEEHRAFLSYDSEDAGARAQSAQFVTSLATGAVLDWYRKELGSLGFVEERSDAARSLATFRRGAASIAVAVQQLAAEAGAVVFVNRVEGGAR